ncbi:MAG: hypothetical protein M0Z56_01165 [Desulfobacteraceae bacterium]|nr:hypothetical protein [Desulfobacteraceae bacterium]
MSKFESFHNKISSSGFISIFFAVFVLFFAAFRIVTPEFEKLSGGLRIPDIAIVANANDIYSLFKSYGQEGRAFYNYIQAMDAVYPLSYGLFFISLIYFYIKKLFKKNSAAGYLIIVPYITACSDYGENICIFIINRSFPAKFGIAADMALLFSYMKWFFFMLSVSIILLGTITFFIKKASGKIGPEE